MRCLFVVLLVVFGCRPMSNRMASKKTHMENIDLEFHRQNAINNESVIIRDSTIIRTVSVDEDNSYMQYISIKGSPAAIVKSYYASRKLKSEGKMFFEFYTGTYRQFDEDGNILDEIYYDMDYSFSVDQLVEKMYSDFKIDILNPYDTKGVPIIKVIKGTVEKKSVYIISMIATPDDLHRLRVIIVDAKTGETLSDKVEYIHP